MKLEEQFDLRALMRLGLWGVAAVAALSVAVLAARSDTGTQRLAGKVGGPAAQLARNSSSGNLLVMRGSEQSDEARRVAETVRSLATDRDRLLARVTVLERNLEDVTGSIGRSGDNASATSSPLPPNASLMPAGPTIASAIVTPPVPSLPRRGVPAPSARVATAHAEATGDVASTESIATTTAFGIDIGGGATIEALRDLWSSAKGNHGTALGGLRPVIAVRDSGKPGSVDLRLIAGPLANAGAAAKICATLAAGGWSCRPAVFDGQKLAIH